jgi:hypothetical protein
MSCLFIAPSFFGYANRISVLLKARFGEVYWFEDRSSVTSLGKTVARLAPRTMEDRSLAYFQNIADSLEGKDVTCVFVIKGEMLSVDAIKMLRQRFLLARFILYFWDSYKNTPPSTPEKVGLFDKAYSFDLEDVKNDRRLAYRPLFYIDDFRKIAHQSDFEFDLLFFGTDHTDRFKVLNKVCDCVPDGTRIKLILYSPSRILHVAKKLLRVGKIKKGRFDFVVQPITSGEVASLISRSRAVLDIERTVQTGLTMRTVEVLASGRKLVTTNSYISNSNLYNSNNICIIDRDNPVISESFLTGGFEDLSDDILEYYGLDGWFDTIFDL